MTTANTLMNDMLTTQKAANKWTKNAYRTASTELYELLSECYAHTQFYRSADISFKLQLNQLLRDAKHTFNEGTRIETKVVRVVFGEVFTGAIGRSRGAIYSKVLTAAHEEKVSKDNFVKWLTTQGSTQAKQRQNCRSNQDRTCAKCSQTTGNTKHTGFAAEHTCTKLRIQLGIGSTHRWRQAHCRTAQQQHTGERSTGKSVCGAGGASKLNQHTRTCKQRHQN